MRILFVSYSHLDCNSGIHIFNLANWLTQLGAECLVCVPSGAGQTARLGYALFETVDYAALCARQVVGAVDLIHAWTPRENVRSMTAALVRRFSCPYLVHLEDNEEYLTEVFTGLPIWLLRLLPGPLLDRALPPGLTHPGRYRDFLSAAAGITLITDRLADFCPKEIPITTFWAGYEEDMAWDMPADQDLRRHLGIRAEDFVLAYTGNVHTANLREISAMYEAVLLLNRHGRRVRLVLTGENSSHLLRLYQAIAGEGTYIELGHIPRRELPRILSIADVLLQPGKADRFNNFRFPSKVPEYLASGKPVILPRANIGRYLHDGEDCLLLEQGTPRELAGKVEQLLADPDLRARMGARGQRFARAHLTWSQQAQRLYEFYTLLAHTG